jgi:uncharacterized protein
MSTIVVFIIRIYQFLFSPDQGALFRGRIRACRFYPSCSEYTVEALQTNGFWYGLLLGARRVARCHPWQNGGYDPVNRII